MIFAEQALINAADAMLARDGFGANSHAVRFSYPGLPPIYSAERSLIDAVRASRNRAQYDSGGDVDPKLADRARGTRNRGDQAADPLGLSAKGDGLLPASFMWPLP